MKIFLKLFIFCVGFVLCSILGSRDIIAANECSQIWIDPASTVVPGTIITFRASGCPPSNVGYQVQILNDGAPFVTLDMAALTADKSQYSATIPQVTQLNQGNYAVVLIDKSANNPIQGTTLKIGSDTVVTDIYAEANLDAARNLNMCIGGFASENDLHSTVVKFSCTAATPFIICPQPIQISYIDAVAEIDSNGKYKGCKTQNVDSRFTQITLDFFQGPTQIYHLVVDTTVGRAEYLCRPGGNPEANGIQTAIGCVPIDTTTDLISFFVRWSMGIVGGIAMILLIIASYQVITSQGDKYKLQSGKDMFLAALSGVVLAIFAILLVRVFGQDILNLF